MFSDARDIADAAEIEAECCIIGGGVAGITIARELSRKSKMRVCLLEAGGFTREAVVQQFYDGLNISDLYPDEGSSFEQYLTISRSRFLGGSSNCWGGWCRPYSEVDFKARPWVPWSGWPIGREELLPYYAKAHEILRLGPVDFDADFWEKAVGHREFRTMPLRRAGRVETQISQFSPPVRFGQEYRDELARGTNLRVVLHANVTEIETSAGGETATRVHVASLTGRRFRVSARKIVLAAGGVENPRLLLLSNRTHGRGIGNAHDLVGRFFMEHARVPAGRAVFSGRYRPAQCYDELNFYRDRRFAARGVMVAAHLGITEAEQQRLGMLNSRTFFRSSLWGDDARGVMALRNLYRWLQGTHKFRRPRPADLVHIIAGLPALAVLALGRATRARPFLREYRLVHVVEPCPSPESRVMLGNERDALGLPKVVLDWRRHELERHTIRCIESILDGELRAAGLGNVEAWDATGPWPSDMQWVWHHMGTTRMSENPRQGVVDPDLKVHGMTNLYVAGSSTFPTGGPDAPTLTITAMALRLADHLAAAEPAYRCVERVVGTAA